ncbi:MAG TPA: PKD domain-containing protein [Thermoanaerobaculia bacterium]|jgi:hypothetical protein|nr:PKD domain-containing protein [Thermoanaerobaculia bacterium]
MRSNRVPIAVVLFLALPLTAWAAVPASGTLTDTSAPLTYSAGPFAVANPTPVLFVDQGPECLNPLQPCDDFALTVVLPAGYHATHPNAAVRVTLGWTDNGAGVSDYDLYIYKGTVINTDGSQAADYQSASGDNPEVGTISPLADGPATYTVKIIPYTPSAETVQVKIELLEGPGGGGGGFGGADPTVPGAPRYQTFYPPAGSSAEAGNGEFNIGFNPRTRRIMTMNTGPVWRLTPAEVANPAAPESCPALWEDVSAASTNVGVDPILFTDQKTGRTFASNSTVGANAIYAFSDDDGGLWVPAAAAPPSATTDHETIGSGPYPPALSALANSVNQGQAVYYCAQTWPLGPAACQRSDTLGSTYGPGVFAYEGNGVTACSGIHGHVRVAPNGTVWLPVRDCGGEQGGVTSTDGGTTWNEFTLPGSRAQSVGADPSIAIDSDNNAYFCYVNDEPVAAGNPPEGHVHVRVSRDGGATWINDFDLGAAHGIKNAAHPEAIAGSSGRAACGFFGTNVAGDYQALGFPGVWYAFIATTYDGGETWTTVNASPNDPVQRASGIWQGGGSNTNRNLLDFNEITVDDNGRVLYGYSDGCVSAGCVAGTAANDFVAHMRVARQIGGRTLFASKDTAEPAAPRRACLAGTRGPEGSHLTWSAPDNGGADISGYQVFRGTTAGNQVLIGQTNGETSYDDTTADPAVASYTYTVRAVNAAGTGAASNAVVLSVVPPPPPENVCEQPGLTRLSDASGDTSAALGIVTTPAPPGADLRRFRLAQPYAADGVVKLAFTLETDAGRSPQPPGSAWYVAFKIADPAPATTFRYRAVHMAWNGTAPVFESYTPSANNSGGVDGRFVTAGSTKPADPSSKYVAPFDKVVIVVKASDLGLKPGDTIVGFVSGVSQTAANTATALYDQMPDSLTFGGSSYTVRENRQCAPQTLPVAVLQATPNVGCGPLTVTFDGSQSFDADGDALTSYKFDFGDGSAGLTQASPAATHSYPSAGTYVGSLQVTDARGGTSGNGAHAQVTVSAAPAAPAITAPGTAKPHQQGLIASVPSHEGSQYAWSIQNGTITEDHGTNQITFSTGSKGQLILSVREITGQGCMSATGTANVAVTNKK